MDGIKGNGNQVVYEQVFVLAASNLPWDLDTAVLRRYAYMHHIIHYTVVLCTVFEPINRCPHRSCVCVCVG